MLLKISRQWIIHCLIHTVMLEADSSIIFFFIIKGKSSLQCYKVEKLCGDSFWSVRFKVCFLLETLRLISSILYSSLGKTGLDCGLLHLTVFFLFVCLDWLIQVTTCYFFVQVLWLDFFSPLMVQISYLPAVSLWWKLCAGREPLVAELGWWTWPWL